MGVIFLFVFNLKKHNSKSVMNFLRISDYMD